MAASHKTVLVVEDEADFREILVDALKLEGYNVLEARNGQESLDIAEAEKPDLIMLDISMPVMTGDKMLEELRKTHWGRKTHVIVLTNMNETDEIIQTMSETEPTYYLVKVKNDLTDIMDKVNGLLLEEEEAE